MLPETAKCRQGGCDAAIYARRSTDKQSTDSPADRIARPRAFGVQRGWAVAGPWSPAW
jgi:hypothetical protein